ncbi:MAG: histidine--tRNA ligase [Burkholderiales bacterium]|nr:MAG: histidine--tRNA ligase [Burkholderiales bacterium]
MKPGRISGVRGMNDLLPADAAVWERVEDIVRSWARSYGYQPIRTPVVEPTPLFARGLGEVTDIVEKEMYTFVDQLNGESLTLRPEATAGVVRAVLQHNLLYDGPKRLWYMGPMFRHERPQRGRYRQFHQIGAEALGFAGPDVDAELIVMCQRLWDDLGLEGIRLELNSIGDSAERKRHRGDLIAYFEAHQGALDEDAERRLYANPLRILDSKNPRMQTLIEDAPKLLDYLDGGSRDHFEGVQALLREAGVAFRINHRLVRGMDYYNRTVFEWVTDRLGAQGTVCGGGRYDPLIEMLGGKPAPACGFAIGLERLIDLVREAAPASDEQRCDVYVVHAGEGAAGQAFRVAEALRGVGLDVVLHAGGGGFKAQFRRADASGAELAVVIGEDEAHTGVAGVKWLRSTAGRDSAGRQQQVPMAGLAEFVVNAIVALGEDDGGD